jgi:hypothetical protein
LESLPPIIGPGNSAKLMLDVTNTGNREGAEPIQLYIYRQVASVTGPVKELRDFKSIGMGKAVDPGARDIMVGPNFARPNDHAASGREIGLGPGR